MSVSPQNYMSSGQFHLWTDGLCFLDIAEILGPSNWTQPQLTAEDLSAAQCSADIISKKALFTSNVSLIHSFTTTTTTTTASNANIQNKLYEVHPIMAAYWNYKDVYGYGVQNTAFRCVQASFPKNTRTKKKNSGVKIGGGGVSWVAMAIIVAVGTTTVAW